MSTCLGKNKSGQPCKRKCKNELYCFQHSEQKDKEEIKELKINNTNLIQKAFISPIIANILIFTDLLRGLNKESNKIFQKERYKYFQKWIFSYDKFFNFDGLNKINMNILYKLYHTKINNYPNLKLLKKYENEYLNFDDAYLDEEDEKEANEEKKNHIFNILKNIFYSKEYCISSDKCSIYEIEKLWVNADEKENCIILNKIISENLDIKKIRCGDIIRFQTLIDYGYDDKNGGVMIYNGTKFIPLGYEIRDSGYLPDEFNIINFPIVNYFEYTIGYNDIVWLWKNIDSKKEINEEKISDHYYKYKIENLVIYGVAEFKQKYENGEKLMCTWDNNEEILYNGPINSNEIYIIEKIIKKDKSDNILCYFPNFGE
jgi:hypothetical protein